MNNSIKEENTICFNDLVSSVNKIEENVLPALPVNSILEKIKETTFLTLQQNPYVILNKDANDKRESLFKLSKELRGLNMNDQFLLAIVSLMVMLFAFLSSNAFLIFVTSFTLIMSIISMNHLYVKARKKLETSEITKKFNKISTEGDLAKTVLDIYKTGIPYIDKNIIDIINANKLEHNTPKHFFEKFTIIDTEIEKLFLTLLPNLNLSLNQEDIKNKQ